jgi:hypothetical protein
MAWIPLLVVVVAILATVGLVGAVQIYLELILD